jgi:hypothetical protein
MTVMIGCAWLLALSQTRAEEEPAPSEPLFSTEQLEQLVAPIALYPDSLVAQILMASTYPLEIVQANRWRESHADLEGEELEQALASESWEPSVKALTNFPDVLRRMSDNLDWTQDLGDAVLAQQEDVMDAVQRMRWLAYDDGNLETTPEQQVIVQEKVIVVEPATEVIYVPAYSPTVVYGAAWQPASYYYPFYRYPSSYWYPPGYAASNIISFGVGMAVGAAIWGNWNWGHCDWRRRNVTINNNFNFSRNINTRNLNIGRGAGGAKFSKWRHNPNHRGGVRYRDTGSKQRFSKARLDGRRGGRIDRDVARGFDRSGKRDLARADRRDLKRPETRDRQRAERRDLKRPETRDRQQPQRRDTARAQDRSARVQGRSVSRETTRSQRRDVRSGGSSRSGSAFNVGRGGFDRAASRRGASSRSGGLSGGSRGGRGGSGRRG